MPSFLDFHIHAIVMSSLDQIFAERKRKGITLTKMYWLLRRKSKLSASNKFLTYKAILKPVWTDGIQLWGTDSTSNIEILKFFQSKVLCMIVDAPWYVPNTVIQRDLQTPTSAYTQPHGSTRQQAIAKTPSKRSAYQIHCLIPAIML
jgi:hypothetical protein